MIVDFNILSRRSKVVGVVKKKGARSLAIAPFEFIGLCSMPYR